MSRKYDKKKQSQINILVDKKLHNRFKKECKKKNLLMYPVADEVCSFAMQEYIKKEDK